MIDIEGIKKRVDAARHYATCPKARNECKQCDTWFYAAANIQHIIRTFVSDIDSISDSRDDIIRERGMLRGELDRFGIKYREDTAELDELRTRHSRLVDSTDTFVAALVDERFKKDHASMLAELHTLRTKNIEASKTMRVHINAMPESARSIFESARQDAKAKGATILRTLVDWVVDARAVQMDRDAQLTALSAQHRRDDALISELRDECRKHLARINVLESERDECRIDGAAAKLRAAILESDARQPIPMILHCPSCSERHIDTDDFATRPHHTHACQECGMVWRPAIVATIGVQFLPGFKDATTLPANESTGQDVAKSEYKAKDAIVANVVPDDVLQRAIVYVNVGRGYAAKPHDLFLARRAMNGEETTATWYNDVREFVKLWREGRAPDRPHPVKW